MRAVFTVAIPHNKQDEFPANEEIIRMLRSFGYEPTEVAEAADEPSKLQLYKDMSEHLFSLMPEVAQEERNKVIYYGQVPDEQTKFVVTKPASGYFKVRLLHEQLN